MITLKGKLKKDGEVSKSKDFNKRISVRDKLLVKEVSLCLYLLQLLIVKLTNK